MTNRDEQPMKTSFSLNYYGESGKTAEDFKQFCEQLISAAELQGFEQAKQMAATLAEDMLQDEEGYSYGVPEKILAMKPKEQE